MPTYSYRCTNCANAFDIHQSFSDDALTTCDECGSGLRKVFGAVGVTFKGSGFYRTDSGAGAKSKTSALASKSESASPSSASNAGASSAGSPSPAPATAS